eukprot:CAMPEP_0168512414 /NCGR_PEP_ID=MMETSP0405-20121227/2766_1 /TAXON_ID=498012 /ORGANISM="Trichosphaerium sp, Strain Am-I-7 wt" /LENGTH=138 /DNA_ID=CAMNT_0008530877 /DNA_START=105 /DNA_END=518 /DNA_ORIENTATION=-
MASHWNEECGGGIPWMKCGNLKASIQNELLFNLAMRLYSIDKEGSYLNIALKVWSWLKNSGLQNDVGLFNNNLEVGTCDNSRATAEWTYNQAIVLRPLVDLSIAFPDQRAYFLGQAERIADSVLNEENGFFWKNTKKW